MTLKLTAADTKEIEKLAKLLEKTGLTEIEIEQDDQRLRLRREDPRATILSPTAQPSAAAPATQSSQPPQPVTPPENALKAPLVGTFYRSPAPDAAAYVNVGDKVKKGQTIGIIEAMKTMNHIEAEQDGVVRDILLADGEPVEYGQPLMVIS